MARRFAAPSLILFVTACGLQPSAAEVHYVEMRGLEFTPAVLNVRVGDTVVWRNTDVMPHTATSDDGSWDSGSLEAGDEWSLSIDEAGAVDYACAFHPTMTGVINAE
ncbi:MAG: cupredoxin family copper-binding protein [Pseudomonadota bacterium]|nr:cupredoxin family copper-binding protein [Pseudomonadota bacterium]